MWICPHSLGNPLEELSITNVPEIRIAPGALSNRLTGFRINVTGVSETLNVPRDAFTVDAPVLTNVHLPILARFIEEGALPQIKIVIVNATSVKFKSGSVSAPRVWIEVREAETLAMETNAMEALSSPLDVVLKVSFTQNLFLEPHSAIVKTLWVTNTSRLLLQEDSVEVTVPDGEIVLSQVEDVALLHQSIIVGGSAKLKFTNVSLRTLSHRAIVSTNPLSLSSLVSVVVTGPSTTPICVATRHLVLKDITAAMGEHNTAAACFKFSQSLEMDQREYVPGVVMSKTTTATLFLQPRTFPDPRCALCSRLRTGQSWVLLRLCTGYLVLHHEILFFLLSWEKKS